MEAGERAINYPEGEGELEGNSYENFINLGRTPQLVLSAATLWRSSAGRRVKAGDRRGPRGACHILLLLSVTERTHTLAITVALGREPHGQSSACPTLLIYLKRALWSGPLPFISLSECVCVGDHY